VVYLTKNLGWDCEFGNKLIVYLTPSNIIDMEVATDLNLGREDPGIKIDFELQSNSSDWVGHVEFKHLRKLGFDSLCGIC